MDRKLKILGFATLTLGIICVGWLRPFTHKSTSLEAPPDRAWEAPSPDRVVVEAEALKSPEEPHASNSRSSSKAEIGKPQNSAVLTRQTTVRREIDTRLDRLAQMFDNESRDADWAELAESVLSDIAGGPDLPQTRVLRNLCKQTLCMAEYATRSREEYHRLAELADIGGSEGYFVEVDAADDDAKHLLIYLARAGQRLPTMR